MNPPETMTALQVTGSVNHPHEVAETRALASPRGRIRDDAETLIHHSRSAGFGDPSPEIVQEIEWAAAMDELTLARDRAMPRGLSDLFGIFPGPRR